MSVSINLDRKEERLEQGFVVVAKDRMQSRKGFKQLVIAPISHSLKWSDWANSGLSRQSQIIKNLCGHTSLALTCFDYPKKMKRAWNTLGKFACYVRKGETRKAVLKTKNVFSHTVSAAAVVGNTYEIGEKVGLLTLSARQIQFFDAVGFLGYISLFWSATHGILKDLQKLSRFQIGEKNWNLTLTKLIAKVCLVFISVFAMVSFVYGPGLVAKWILLSVGTTSLIISIFNHFYDEMYAIEEKKNTRKSLDV
ncbi:MAG: hypothetical protein KR126chlam1_01083 [Chlamydiae bacterium]|nr:hypothetical protein [Chlamydiota bacterium]